MFVNDDKRSIKLEWILKTVKVSHFIFVDEISDVNWQENQGKNLGYLTTRLVFLCYFIGYVPIPVDIK